MRGQAGRWSHCVKDICDNYAAIGADDTVVIDHNAPVWCAGFIGKAIRWPGTHNIAFFYPIACTCFLLFSDIERCNPGSVLFVMKYEGKF